MRNKGLVTLKTKTKEENQNSLIVREQRYKCPRCDMELENRDGTPLGIMNDGICPRCAYDIKGTIDLSEDLVDPQVLKDKAGAIAFKELMIILDNWLISYKRIVEMKGVDWSLPHEFFQEFTDLMVPYISRLKQTGYATDDRMKAIGQKVVDALHEIIESIQAEEDIMRLTGQWSALDEEIRLEWIDKMEITQRLIAS